MEEIIKTINLIKKTTEQLFNDMSEFFENVIENYDGFTIEDAKNMSKIFVNLGIIMATAKAASELYGK